MSADDIIVRMVATVCFGLAATAGFVGFAHMVVSILHWWVGA